MSSEPAFRASLLAEGQTYRVRHLRRNKRGHVYLRIAPPFAGLIDDRVWWLVIGATREPVRVSCVSEASDRTEVLIKPCYP